MKLIWNFLFIYFLKKIRWLDFSYLKILFHSFCSIFEQIKDLDINFQ